MGNEAITKEMDAIYRKVRRFYAQMDVERWLADHDYDTDVFENLEGLVDDYDEWQGDNPYWYEAIGIIAKSNGYLEEGE